MIVEIIKSIVAFNTPLLNEKILPLVAHTNIQIKQFQKSNSKGMIAILLLFGSPEPILDKYEKEYMEHQAALKLEEGVLAHTMDDNDDPLTEEVMSNLDDNLKKYSKLSKEELMHLGKIVGGAL